MLYDKIFRLGDKFPVARRGHSQQFGRLAEYAQGHNISRRPEARWIGRCTARASSAGSAQIWMAARARVTAV